MRSGPEKLGNQERLRPLENQKRLEAKNHPIEKRNASEPNLLLWSINTVSISIKLNSVWKLSEFWSWFWFGTNSIRDVWSLNLQKKGGKKNELFQLSSGFLGLHPQSSGMTPQHLQVSLVCGGDVRVTSRKFNMETKRNGWFWEARCYLSKKAALVVL